MSVGRLCAEHDIPHLVNNAYGLASSKVGDYLTDQTRLLNSSSMQCCHLVSEAARATRLDLVVQVGTLQLVLFCLTELSRARTRTCWCRWAGRWWLAGTASCCRR